MLVGQNIDSGNVNFKFFGQKGWGLEWVGPGAYTLKEGGNYIKYASDGNFQSAEMWPTGKYMVMKPAGLWVKALEEMPVYEAAE